MANTQASAHSGVIVGYRELNGCSRETESQGLLSHGSLLHGQPQYGDMVYRLYKMDKGQAGRDQALAFANNLGNFGEGVHKHIRLETAAPVFDTYQWVDRGVGKYGDGTTSVRGKLQAMSGVQESDVWYGIEAIQQQLDTYNPTWIKVQGGSEEFPLTNADDTVEPGGRFIHDGKDELFESNDHINFNMSCKECMNSVIRQDIDGFDHEPNVDAWNDNMKRFFWGDNQEHLHGWPTISPNLDFYPESEHSERTSTGCCPGKRCNPPVQKDQHGQVTNSELFQHDRYEYKSGFTENAKSLLTMGVYETDPRAVREENVYWEKDVPWKPDYQPEDSLANMPLSPTDEDPYYGAKSRVESKPGALVTIKKIVGCGPPDPSDPISPDGAPVFETETTYYQNSNNDWTPIQDGLLTWGTEPDHLCSQLVDFKEVDADYYFRMPGPPGGVLFSGINHLYRTTAQRSFYGIEALIAETEFLRHYESLPNNAERNQAMDSGQFYEDVLEKIMVAINPDNGYLMDQFTGFGPPTFGGEGCQCTTHDCCPESVAEDDDFYLKLSYVRAGCKCDDNFDPFADMLDDNIVIDRVFKVDGTTAPENMEWVNVLLADTMPGLPNLQSDWYSSHCPNADGVYEKGGCPNDVGTSKFIKDSRYWLEHKLPQGMLPPHDACYKLLSAEKCTKVKPIVPDDTVQTAVPGYALGQVDSEQSLLAYGFSKYDANFQSCCEESNETVYDYRVQKYKVGSCHHKSDDHPNGYIKFEPDGDIKIWTSTNGDLGYKHYWEADMCTLYGFSNAGIYSEPSDDSLASFNTWETTNSGYSACYQPHEDAVLGNDSVGSYEYINGSRTNTFHRRLGLGPYESAEDYIADHWQEGKPSIFADNGSVYMGGIGKTPPSINTSKCCETTLRCIEHGSNDQRCKEVNVYKIGEPECVDIEYEGSGFVPGVDAVREYFFGKIMYKGCPEDVALTEDPRPEGCLGTTEYCSNNTGYCEAMADSDPHLEIPCDYVDVDHFPTQAETSDFCGEDSVCTPEPEPSPFPEPTPHYDPKDIVYVRNSSYDGDPWSGVEVVTTNYGHPADAETCTGIPGVDYYMAESSPYSSEDNGTYGGGTQADVGLPGTFCKKLISHYEVDEDTMFAIDLNAPTKREEDGELPGKKHYRGIFAAAAAQAFNDFRTTTKITDKEGREWDMSKYTSKKPPSPWMWSNANAKDNVVAGTLKQWYDLRIAAADAACETVRQVSLAPSFGEDCNCTTNSSGELINENAQCCVGDPNESFYLNITVNSPECCIDGEPSYGEIFPRKTESVYYLIDGSTDTFDDNREWITAISQGAIGTTCAKVMSVYPQGPLVDDQQPSPMSEQELVEMGFHLNITSPSQSFLDGCCNFLELYNTSEYWRYPVKVSTIDTCTYGYRGGYFGEEIPYDEGVTEHWAAPVPAEITADLHADFTEWTGDLSNLVFYEYDTCRKFEIGKAEGPFSACGNEDKWAGLLPGDFSADDLQWYINGDRCLTDPTGGFTGNSPIEAVTNWRGNTFGPAWHVEPPTLGQIADMSDANFDYQKCCKIQHVCESGECKSAMVNVFGEDELPLPCCDYQGTKDHPEDRYASCDDPVNCIPPTIPETPDLTDKPCTCLGDHYSESGGDTYVDSDLPTGILPICDDCVEIEETPAPPSVDITSAVVEFTSTNPYVEGNDTKQLEITYAHPNVDTRETPLHITLADVEGNLLYSLLPEIVPEYGDGTSTELISAPYIADQESVLSAAHEVIIHCGPPQNYSHEEPFREEDAVAFSRWILDAGGTNDPHITTFFGEKYDM